jgi:DNA polymerase elongation subunit (family B)
MEASASRALATAGALCGVWVDRGGEVRLSVATAAGGREERAESFRPFAWIGGDLAGFASVPGLETEGLRGPGRFQHLAHADSPAAYEALLAAARSGAQADAIRPLEAQFLLQRRFRLFRDLGFAQLRRCQVDIETGSEDGSFSQAGRPGDRVLAIGLRTAGRNRLLLLEAPTDAAEKRLLESFNAALAEWDPDVIEGHNLFQFDLDYLRQRCRRLRVRCAWGRFGQSASFRMARLKAAERWIDFPRCDLAGRAVVDTYLLVQLYDLTAREMTSYGLKAAAVYFGITPEDGAGRTYLEGGKIAESFASDRARFCAYLEDDLRETQGVADLLLPTYFEQARAFPILLQDAMLRGTTAKIDLLFLEEYYHARQACPVPPEIHPFAGGYTKSFQDGVFRHVLHFDVASLYPSLLLAIGRNPRNDSLGVFIPLLKSLREYRLKFKALARDAPAAEERAEAQARQSAFKILINSFYGYLGFSGARFGDGELAAEVTRRGREMLQALIDEFGRQGCTLLEADTDGIYVSSERYFEAPEALLSLVAAVLPPGIELEYDGKYAAMFCYKAKNYALYDGKQLLLRGSAFRSRGIEPYLQRLTDQLIKFLVGAVPESPLVLLEDYRRRLAERTMPVVEIAKSETLSQDPNAYEHVIGLGGKPRRAAAEAALQLSPRPRAGERVSYYIGPRASGRVSDWQRARPVELFDAVKAPYDPIFYQEKLEDWLERYGAFLGLKSSPIETQGELL